MSPYESLIVSIKEHIQAGAVRPFAADCEGFPCEAGDLQANISADLAPLGWRAAGGGPRDYGASIRVLVEPIAAEVTA